jgi:hypothetical protein
MPALLHDDLQLYRSLITVLVWVALHAHITDFAHLCAQALFLAGIAWFDGLWLAVLAVVAFTAADGRHHGALGPS